MTTNQSFIGQLATYRVTPNPKSQDVIAFDVVIVASRNNFGRTDLRIKPAQGTGEVWICSDSVQFTNTNPPYPGTEDDFAKDTLRSYKSNH